MGGPHELGDAGDEAGVRSRAGDRPLPTIEQLDRPVVRLGLHVLWQREGHRPGLGRVGQDPHRPQQGRGQLLGAPDPVEVRGHRAQRVVDRDVVPARGLELLQHGSRGTRGEHVPRQQQHRQPVDGGQRGARDQVGRARADRGGARQRRQTVAHARVRDGCVHHALLVSRLVVGQQRRVVELALEQRLPHAGHVAMTEDPEAALHQPLRRPVALAVLHREEAHQRLGHGESDGRHAGPPGVNGRRGSAGTPGQASRTQACAGSSQISQARSSPGPAMTFR